MAESFASLATAWELALARAGLSATELAWIVAGSGIGGAARLLVTRIAARYAGEAFPWGTLAVNVTGAFAIGVLAAAASAGLPLPGGWPFLALGIVGSYTTVSSFSLDTLMLARAGEHGRAVSNVAASLAAGLGAVALGLAAGRLWFDGLVG